MHLGVVAVSVALAFVARPPLVGWVIPALISSLIHPAVYTLAALRIQPDPARTLLAFAYLPLYTAWRLVTAMRAFSMLGSKPWVRTERHADKESSTSARASTSAAANRRR